MPHEFAFRFDVLLTRERLAVSVAFLLSALPCQGGTVRVPDDFATIQAAILGSSDGDSIVVAPGQYDEAVSLHWFRYLIGEAGAAGTIIDGGNVRVPLNCGSVQNALVQGFTIQNGSGTFGGGVRITSSLTIRECIIQQNHATWNGGGVYVQNCAPTFVNCTIRDNFTPDVNGAAGGGFYLDHANPTLIDCDIRSNEAPAGGGMLCSFSSPQLLGCTIANNTAFTMGGGLYVTDLSVPEIAATTVTQNSADTGGGLFCIQAQVYFQESIIWDNHGGEIHTYLPPAFVSFACSDVNTSGISGGGFAGDAGGSISLPPLFCDPGHGVYTLDGQSPCLPENNSCEVLMGGEPAGCGLASGFSLVESSAFSVSSPSTGASFIDLDGDSDLDLHVLRELLEADKSYRNDGSSGFAALFPNPLADGGRGNGMDWGDYDNDGLLDLYVVNSTTANKLYRNLGGGNFADVTTPPLNHGSFDQGASWIDYDRDGRLDLYLTTHFSPNKLYRNLGNGSFVESTPAALAIPLKCGASAWGDYDNDGDSDAFVSVQDGADVLVRNDGATFANVTQPPMNDAGLAQGAAWGDYDNDSDLDLLVCNFGTPNRLYRNDAGSFANVASGDLAAAGSSQSGTWADYDNDRDLDVVMTRFGAPSSLFRNDAGVFQRLDLGAANDSANSIGASWGDYDQDGDQDLFIAGFGNPDRLYRNDIVNQNNWLEVTLEGTASNRSAIGARITAVDLSSGVTQIREHGSNHGFWSCNQPAEHFGLGTTTRIDFLTIRWPSGAVEVFPDVPANLRLHIIEGGGMVGAPVVTASLPIQVLARPNPFRDVTEIVWAGGPQVKAELTIYDVGGRLVRSIAGEVPGAFRWDGRENGGRTVPNGIYFYRIESDDHRMSGKVVRLR